MQGIDENAMHVLESLRHESIAAPGSLEAHRIAQLRRLFSAQVESRHLDFAARWLQSRGAGYYTIGSAGHESNAAVGLLSRADDPALLHYRSGGFYAARAATAGYADSVRDVLLGLTSAADDPMSGGRHKVFGNPLLHIIPQTSTISSHLPRAVGLAFSLGLAARGGHTTPWPDDALVVCSFGDASANHSTALGAINAASYLAHRGIDCPILFVCEDNRIGISTPSPRDWPAVMLRNLAGVSYRHARGDDPIALLNATDEALQFVRQARGPAVLHLRTVRFMGHAGSDTEIAYRTPTGIAADYDHDPLLATARTMVTNGVMTAMEALHEYEATRSTVMREADSVMTAQRLGSRSAVMAPLRLPETIPATQSIAEVDRSAIWRGRLPESGSPLTLAQSINTTLTDILAAQPRALVFGEDVAVKGGVYGVTRGLRKRFGGQRVFDTLLDEQTILGVALGSALAGFLPIPEIQYLAYFHNAEDQVRGEAASLRFFSNGQYRNGMVIRIAGLAYQRGFGGHFHNDNSVAVLRDVPGLVIAVPSHPHDAPGLLRTCVSLAQNDARVCVFIEPIARYHTRDALSDGDGQWTAMYCPPDQPDSMTALGAVRLHGSGRDLLLVTFGNGVYLSVRAAERLRELGVDATILDLRWLAPLPTRDLLEHASRFDAVLVVDETRHSGGVSEAVLGALIDGMYAGRLARVNSADSFIPLGPAAETVLLSEAEIIDCGLHLVEGARSRGA